MNSKFVAEKSSETSRWSETFTETLAEARSYIGSARYWRISDFDSEKTIEQSDKKLPPIFNDFEGRTN